MSLELTQVIHEVEILWLPTAQAFLGCPAMIDLAATEEHEWGWLIYVVPVNEALCTRAYKKNCFAVERETGISTPVGTKGIEEALIYFSRHRKLQ